MMNIRRVILTITALVLSSGAITASASENPYYFGAQYVATSVESEGFATWEPDTLVFKGGYRITDFFAVEGRVGFSVSDDQVNGATVEVDSLAGIYTKFSHDAAIISPYVLLGITNVNLDVEGFGGIDDGSNNDLSYGLGLDIDISKNSDINLEYMNYYDDEDTKITGLALGYTYSF